MDRGWNRRHALRAAAALAMTPAFAARAQEAKGPLRIIVPLPAGGVADASVRMFGDSWTALTKQSVVVDNRPGGNFQIAMQQLQLAPPDGNTWIHLNNTMSATQATFQRYDLTKQLVPIGMLGGTPGALFVSANGPFAGPKDLFDWMRANPGKANYGVTAGGVEHMTTVVMLRKAGLQATMVPFKGGPDICTALAQNELHFAITALPLVVPFKGRIKPLGVLSDARSPMLPDLPTGREQSLAIQDLNYWGAFAVPAGTPAATVSALNTNLVEALKSPSLQQRLAQQGMFAKGSSPEAMAKIIADELAWMTPIAAELDLKAG